MSNSLALFDNVIVWLILCLAMVCYSLLMELIIAAKDESHVWFQRAIDWLDSLQILLSALPLLGLLGTIVGLLQTFRLMALGGVNQQELFGRGIADAMFTTEMGLLMVIPGWLLLAYLKFQLKNWERKTCAAI